jgi:6,7-dimethyl-8-ribityllumazine synthase
VSDRFEELRRAFDEDAPRGVYDRDVHEETSEDVLSALVAPQPAGEDSAVADETQTEAKAKVEPEDEPEPEPEPLVEPEPVAEHAPPGFRLPDGYATLEGTPSGDSRSVGVVVSRFNGDITTRLLEHALSALEEQGVAREAVTIVPVPGAFELPLAAMALAKTRQYACIVALGCVIRGETAHFEYVAGEAASGLQLAGLETGIPVAFGVLTCENVEQAEARIERAGEVARGALEMADLFGQMRAQAG